MHPTFFELMQIQVGEGLYSVVDVDASCAAPSALLS